ncbi:recombinase family protein [Nocardiopsis changdeensis]|uniref:Recombinase family protein n=1 Tax=Nocardiopsis changdeensis TaxID=2831969 RepID=A0ABX8BLB0_9ACTN|nr:MULTISPECIES: recombinase family protein [Nocardiopsis]QUX23015.1 recombinase family protein [Nocardiopsis changdeensis]QYX38960.1 recombinase family protein [Nocardiopsis sp. MT53]
MNHTPPTLTLPRPPGAAGVPLDLIPAIGYIRVSKSREEMISPEIQRQAIKDWARRNGRWIVDWVEDLDESGRYWQRRIMSVIERVEAGEARDVIVWKYSRFGRDRSGNVVNLGRLNRAGGELESATEDIDASTSVGKLSRGLLMEIAAFESDRMAESWAETWTWRLDQGLPARGGPRWGYEHVGRIPNPVGPGSFRDPNTQEAYLPIEEMVPHAVWAFEAYNNGSGYKPIAREWNRRGLVTIAGGPWAETTVRGVMLAGFMAGQLQMHDPACTRDHPRRHRGGCTQRIRVPGAHEPMITVDAWETYLERSARRAAAPVADRTAKHLLSGGIFQCGHSGDRMKGAPNQGKIQYKCVGWASFGRCAARTVREEVVVPHLLADIAAWADDLEAAAAERAREQEEAPAAPVVDETDQARKEVERLDRKIGRLVDLYMDGDMEKSEYADRRGKLDAERAAAAARLEELEGAQQADPAEYIPVARGLVEEWASLPLAHQRELLHQLVERIEMFRESATKAWIVVRLADGTEHRHDVSHDYTGNTKAAIEARRRALKKVL